MCEACPSGVTLFGYFVMKRMLSSWEDPWKNHQHQINIQPHWICTFTMNKFVVSKHKFSVEAYESSDRRRGEGILIDAVIIRNGVRPNKYF